MYALAKTLRLFAFGLLVARSGSDVDIPFWVMVASPAPRPVT